MMSALKPTEGFMLSMKLSFVAGIVLSFPLLLLFILQFVLPGLHSHEKRVMWPAMAVGFGLFLAGTAFAYYWVLPRALLFFYRVERRHGHFQRLADRRIHFLRHPVHPALRRCPSSCRWW